MQILKKRISQNYQEIILWLLGGIYFFFLLRYYLIDYYVPDFRGYFSMALWESKAQDGFSSLFLWFAAFAASMPTALTIFSLFLLALTMINISFFIKFFLEKNTFYYVISMIVLYSCCAFYYFYGKIFYDFPFTAYTYSVCLLILKKLFVQLDKECSADKIWLILCIGLGFLFSWKTYNIFCVAGLGLLMLGKRKSRLFIFEILKSVRKIIFSVLFFLLGYLMGNYNLLFYPKETLSGIRAYPVNFDFKQFLFLKTRIIWDHVNDLPFNSSVLLLGTTVLFLFILPIVMKKIWYLLVSIFMTICLYFYIQYFSPGYAWHGFPIGLFIVTFVIFLLSEIQYNKKSWINLVIILAVIVQLIHCFGYYIPLQNKWYSITEKAISVLEEKEDEIYADVKTLLNQIGDSYYMIDEAVKRYKPVAISSTAWKKINLQNTYFTATNFSFLDPLEATNYTDWIRLKQNEKYSVDSSVYEYIIWIIPNCFKSMGDVADIHLYDRYNIENQVNRDGYTIYLYKIR